MLQLNEHHANELRDEIDETLKGKFGLTRASKMSISKDTLRRFLDCNYKRSFGEKNKDLLSVFLGFKDFKAFCLEVNLHKPEVKTLQNKFFFFGIFIVFFLIILACWNVTNSIVKEDPNFALVENQVIEINQLIRFYYDL